MEALFDIAKAMTSQKILPCTSCRYCTAHCPQDIDNLCLVELYNEHIYSGGGFLAPIALSALPEDKLPSACIGCQSCEAVCPQNTKIGEIMADFTEKLK